MTTQTVSGSRSHARSDSDSTVSYRPGSPTLSNPEMILPDYEPNRYDNDDDAHSPIMSWDHHGSANGLGIDQVLQSGGVPLTTPILYGNGTMLSDIGEVTEAESTVGGPVGRRGSQRSRMSEHDNFFGSSPPLGSPPLGSSKPFFRRSANLRPVSGESTSTIMSFDRERDMNYAEFDDAVSIEDANFQGDDEESIAGSFADDPSASQLSLTLPNQDENRYSTSSISRRAEKILANAKRRLTTMEDNLTRARGLSYSSSLSEEALTSPPVTSPALTAPSPLLGHATTMRISRVAPGRSRIVSDSMQAVSPHTTNGGLQRSASAVGAAGGYRHLPPSQSDNTIIMNSTAHGISQHPLDVGLERLSEDEGDDSPANSARASQQYSAQGSPSIGYVDPASIARSSSVAQVRDLQEQMNGLKGKIASLREQAMADSMKRRSLQSLRTPSPFTHARWDSNFSDPKTSPTPDAEDFGADAPFQPDLPPIETEEHPELEPRPDRPEPEDASDAETEKNGVVAAQAVEKARDSEDNVRTDTPTTLASNLATKESTVLRHSPVQNLRNAYIQDAEGSRRGSVGSGSDPSREQPRGGSASDDVSESGESVYEEALSTPVSHEDRADAFDYQTFFLHSAMGTLSRQGFRRRGSTGTIDSDSSTETTRAAPPVQQLVRRASSDTVDSFATAREGRESRNSSTSESRDEAPSRSSIREIDTALRGAMYDTSGAEDSSSSREFSHRRALSYQQRVGGAPAVRHGLHRPSVSSFESTGTNRSFPLVSRSRLSASGSMTGSPLRESPEANALKPQRESLPASFRSQRDRQSAALEPDLTIGSGSGSPTVVPLSTEDQFSVDRLVACFNRCVEGLTDLKESPNMRSTYRRRLEAARRILEGEDELF